MVITSSAPTRICDLGGWTDTWFARYGVVCSLPVWPGVDVTVRAVDAIPGVHVRLPNVSRAWHWTGALAATASPDPLVAACLEERPVPAGAWQLEVQSQVPPGASMGTSASVCVAVLAALDRVRGVSLDRASLARRAHAIETERLQQQCGIQDQWAAAAGGPMRLTMPAYPEAKETRLALSQATCRALTSQLVVLLLGRGHQSSAVHAEVVAALRDAGADDPRLQALRRCAGDGAKALVDGDLVRYGEVLVRNTAAQATLHPSLISGEARRVIAIAAAHDALGWKVNGAGGDGGSLAVLAASPESRSQLIADVRSRCPSTTSLDVTLARHGVVVHEAAH
ncbi:MAG: GHMP kinase [Acidobacteria bacterium]|nr:GHMP kinase [Acidobacteriota bacterium]